MPGRKARADRGHLPYAQKIVIGLLLGHQSGLTHKGAERICYRKWGQ